MKKTTLCSMALCMLAATACADKMTNSPTGGSGYSASSAGGQPTGRTSAMAGPGNQAQASYGVVQAIEPMQRQEVGVSAMGALGAAAAGGTAGAPTDKVYRVSVRMDDGSNQMVVLESAPGYKIGDRVRYSNGTLLAY